MQDLRVFISLTIVDFFLIPAMKWYPDFGRLTTSKTTWLSRSVWRVRQKMQSVTSVLCRFSLQWEITQGLPIPKSCKKAPQLSSPAQNRHLPGVLISCASSLPRTSWMSGFSPSDAFEGSSLGAVGWGLRAEADPSQRNLLLSPKGALQLPQGLWHLNGKRQPLSSSISQSSCSASSLLSFLLSFSVWEGPTLEGSLLDGKGSGGGTAEGAVVMSTHRHPPPCRAAGPCVGGLSTAAGAAPGPAFTAGWMVAAGGSLPRGDTWGDGDASLINSGSGCCVN